MPGDSDRDFYERARIDRIFMMMDDWFFDGKFHLADAYLLTIDPSEISLIEILGFLSITNFPDSYTRLPSKEQFVRKSIKEIRSREPERWYRLLAGLVPWEWLRAA